MTPLLPSAAVCSLLCLVLLVTAIPWFVLLDPRGFQATARKPLNWAYAVAGILVAGIALAFAANNLLDGILLIKVGRVVGNILQIQLVLSVFALVFPILLFVWPHGGAVALAAFREGVRQPMFWLIIAIGSFLMLISIIFPYFTFGEDAKMAKELGFDTIMMAGVLFSVLAASMSITEEIEGRTAITVMSKPVSRRQFLVGKFLGIFLATALMTGLLSWVFSIVVFVKPILEGDTPGDPSWLPAFRAMAESRIGEGTTALFTGIGLWFDLLLDATPGLIFGLCKAMVLLAIAVALSTRLPMIVDIVTCMIIFYLGHLNHELVKISEARFRLVNFIAKTLQTILPGLDYFDISNLIAKDVAPPPGQLWIYVGFVCLYAVMCSLIALLFGLILFEDRDLA